LKESVLNIKYCLSIWHHCWRKKENECLLYKGYSLFSSATSVVTMKPTSGFWWSHLPALSPVHNRAQVLGHPWRWLALTRMGHLSGLISVLRAWKFPRVLNIIFLLKRSSAIPCLVLTWGHRKQRCYKYVDGGIHTRTKVFISRGFHSNRKRKQTPLVPVLRERLQSEFSLY